MFAIEQGDDVFVIMLGCQSAYFANERVGISNCFRAVRLQVYLDGFDRASLPADLQSQPLWLRALDDGDIEDQQAKHAFAVRGSGCRSAPESRKVDPELQYLPLLFSCDATERLMLEVGQLPLQFEQPLHRVVPSLLERAGDQSVARVDRLITPLGQIDIVAGALDRPTPLCRNGFIAFLKVHQSFERELDRQRCDGSQQALCNGIVKGLGRHGHAAVPRQRFPMLPIALIDGIETTVAGIADTQTPSARATEQQALQQTKALSGWPGEDFTIGAICRQALAVGEELIPRNIAWMVIGNEDAPLLLWHLARLSANLAGGSNLLTRLIAPEHVGTGVRWIG